MIRSSRVIGMLGVVLLLAPASVRAQDGDRTIRAARLTLIQGSVTVDQADNSASEPAQLNMPLLAGVRVSTGEDGQAEVEFEDGSLARLTPNSAMSLDAMGVGEDGTFSTGMSLLHGLGYFELRAVAKYRYSVTVGGDVIAPVENSTVRVTLDEPPAVIAVLDGLVHVDGLAAEGRAGFSTNVRASESLRSDAGDPARYFLTQQIAEDSWDQWNVEQDAAAAAEVSQRTAARDGFAGAQGYGWSDLDANGSWYDVPGQGEVWQPTVAADDSGFDPYGYGSWVYYPVTGYVWASGYAWGWTPYRCGQWSHFDGFGWGWAPGTGCGGYGWGFGRGGINIGYGPRGYRPIPVPRPITSKPHPIIIVKAFEPGERPHTSPGGGVGARRIAGYAVAPLQPVNGGYAQRMGVGPTTSLTRDFPVDRVNHTPMTGAPSTQGPVIYTSSGWRPGASRPAPPSTVYRGQAPAGAASGQPNAAMPSYHPGTSMYRPAAPVTLPTPAQSVPVRPVYDRSRQPAMSAQPGYASHPVASPPAAAPAPRPAPAAAPVPQPARPAPKG